MRILILVLLAACAPHTPPPAAPEPAAEPAAEMLPPAFDAATLRAGFVPGTVMRYRITEKGVPRVEEWTVTAADEATCTMHTKVFADDGTTLSEETDRSAAWTELQSHGTFPAALTTRAESSVEVPAGTFATWYYEVAPGEAGGMTRKFHFAPALVGPPIWAEFGQDGQVAVKMELLSRTNP